MRKTNRKDFKNNLVQAVKDVGQDLINNAEDIVGKIDLLSSITITILLDSERNMFLPVINVEKKHLCRSTYERYISKGEKYDGKET